MIRSASARNTMSSGIRVSNRLGRDEFNGAAWAGNVGASGRARRIVGIDTETPRSLSKRWI